MTTRGTDVAFPQGLGLDWRRIAASDVHFAICKATEHVAGEDPTFQRNAREAGAAKLLVGSYHFFRPEADPEKQASHYAKVALSAPKLHLPPCLDFETLRGVAPREANVKARAFVEVAETLFGMRCMLYTYPGFWAQMVPILTGDDLTFWAARPLAIAHYGVSVPIVPRPWSWWTFHQYDGDGGERLPGGIDADFDRFRGDLDDLATFIESCKLVAPHEPPPSFASTPATLLRAGEGEHTPADVELREAASSDPDRVITNPGTPTALHERNEDGEDV